MTYDDWKLESPEDEDERLNGPWRRRQARAEWEADHADDLREMRDDIIAERDAVLGVLADVVAECAEVGRG